MCSLAAYEDNSKLDKQVVEILTALHAQAEILKPKLDAADREADKEEKRREAQWLIARARHDRDLVEKTRAQSLQDLLKIIDEWNEGKRVQACFEDIATTAASLPANAHADVMSKMEQALTLLGHRDSLTALMS